MLNNPLVSIVTPVLNGETHIEQTICSVTNQTYKNIEYIIIDGGSTDNTLDIIKKYKRKIDKIVCEKDSGIYDAMNKGIQVSKGDLIGIIASDDFFQSDTVQLVVDCVQNEHNIGIIHGNMVYIKMDGRLKTIIPPVHYAKSIFCHPTCFVSKETYIKIGLYNHHMDVCADYDFFLRALKNGIKIKYIDKVLATHRSGGFAYQHDHIYKAKQRISSLLLNQYSFKNILIFVLFTFGSYIKRNLSKKLAQFKC